MQPKFDICDCQFTVLEAAQHLRISRTFLYELIGEKKIKVAKLGSRTIVSGREIQRYVEAVAASAA